MSEEKCMKEDVINDLKNRVEKLEENDREDYGTRRELALSIKMFSESNKEQSKAIVDIGQTLVKVNENLDSLNKEHKEIKKDVIELKEQVNNQKIEEIKNHSWDYRGFFRKCIEVGLVLGFIGLLSEKLGLLKLIGIQF